MKALAVLGIATMATAWLFGAQADQAQAVEQALHPPSLAEVARKTREESAKLPPGAAPLYTNSNLPTQGSLSSVGLNPIGPNVHPGESPEGAFGEKPSPELVQKGAYLQHKLDVARQRLTMDQRELSVLQQQLSQNQMQYYPNPYKSMMQQYTRSNINKKTTAINQKKQEVADDEQAVENLQAQLRDVQQQLTLTGSAAIGGVPASQSVIPPGVRPGTRAYWHARFQAARQALSTANKQERLTGEEISLLKLQQLRVLDPNKRTQIAASLLAKERQEQSAEQAVQKAQVDFEQLQEEFRASGAPGEWAQ